MKRSALDLAIARLGNPADACIPQIIAAGDALYPSQSRAVNREASQLLGVPAVAERLCRKDMKLLAGDHAGRAAPLRPRHPRREGRLDAGTAARRTSRSIKLAQRNIPAGNSFKNFLIRIREDAVATLSEQ